MGTSDETTSSATSKIIEVLYKIDARLESLDRRLQALEPSPVEHAQTSPSAVVGASRTTKYRAFRAKYEVRPGKGDRLRKIIVIGKGLLVLLIQVSNPCLKRNRRYQLDPSYSHKTVDPPFAELMTYWDTLNFLYKVDGLVDNQLRSLLYLKPLTPQLQNDISELLSCVVDSYGDHVEARKNALKGVVLFEHLPLHFGTGTLLIGTSTRDGDCGTQQIVEVSSCEITSLSSGIDHYVVEFWHLRWDGKAFSRTGGRVQIDRYVGTRPINGLPFRPLIAADCENSIAELQRLIIRNQTALDIFKHLSGNEDGDYPLLCTRGRSGTGIGQGLVFLEPVIVDPEAFSRNKDDGPKIRPSFGCYCSACTGSLTLDEIMDDMRYLLLAPVRVEGYHVLLKQWTTLVVSSLSDPVPLSQSDVLDNLYLDYAMAKSLKLDLTRYFEDRRAFLEKKSTDDADNGGGGTFKFDRRLVMHFDGPRGAGKAGLAVSLAGYCNRPILFIRCTELGKRPTAFVKNLANYAELSFRWGAIIVLLDADHLLQSRRADDRDITRTALRKALLDTVCQFQGVMIFVTSHIASLDHSLVPHVRQVTFSPLSAESIVNISRSFLDQLHHDLLGSRHEILEWVADTAANSRLSGREAQEVLRDTIGLASSGKESLGLNDIIKL